MTSSRLRSFALLGAALFLLAACSDGSSDQLGQSSAHCVLNEQIRCACADGSDSIQTCTEEGIFTSCHCPGGGSGGTAGSGGAAGVASASGTSGSSQATSGAAGQHPGAGAGGQSGIAGKSQTGQAGAAGAQAGAAGTAGIGTGGSAGQGASGQAGGGSSGISGQAGSAAGTAGKGGKGGQGGAGQSQGGAGSAQAGKGQNPGGAGAGGAGSGSMAGGAGSGQAGSGNAGSAQAGQAQGGAGSGVGGSGDAGSGPGGFGQAGQGDAGSGPGGSGQAGQGDAGSGLGGSGQAGQGDAGSGNAGSGNAGGDPGGAGGDGGQGGFGGEAGGAAGSAGMGDGLGGATQIGTGDAKVIDVFVAPAGIVIVLDGLVSLRSHTGATLKEIVWPRQITAAALDGDHLAIMDKAKLTVLDLDLVESVNTDLLEPCASSVILSGDRLICGTAASSRTFATYSLVTGELIASIGYSNDGTLMRAIPGSDDFLCVGSSPYAYVLYTSDEASTVTRVNFSSPLDTYLTPTVFAFDSDPATKIITSSGVELLIRGAGCAPDQYPSQCLIKHGNIGTLWGDQSFVAMVNSGSKLYGLVRPPQNSWNDPPCAGVCLLQRIDVAGHLIESKQELTIPDLGSNVVATRYDPVTNALVIGYDRYSSDAWNPYPGYSVMIFKYSP